MRGSAISWGVLVLVLAPGFIPGPASAQTLQVGVTTGWVESTLRSTYTVGGNEFDRSGGRSGYAMGVVTRLDVLGPIALQVEVLDVEKGFSEGSEAPRMHTRYIEVPILLVGRFGLSDRFRPELLVGAAPARERSCRAWAMPRYIGFPPENRVARPTSCVEWRSETGDFGAVVGGGVALHVRSATITFSARHTRGLENIEKTYDFAESRNRTTVFGVSGMVPLWTGDRPAWRVGR
jgi:hypothetical protein